jgi:tetratricopeptide (TPR) repeat protein
VAMGMWDEVVAGNIDSWEASESRRLRKDLTLQDRGYHAFHWLEYGLLQQKEFDQARMLLDSMIADTETLPSQRLRSHLAMMQAGYIVESEQWKTDVFDINVDFTLLSKGVRASNKFAKGMAGIKRGEVEYARTMLKEMIEERILEEPLRVDEDMTVCHAVGGKYFDDLELDSKVAAILESELEALILMTEDRKEEAYALLDQATEAESQLPLAYGPPDIVKPSHELYGEILLLQGNPGKAEEMFEEALKRAPNRRLSVRGLKMSQTMAKDSE